MPEAARDDISGMFVRLIVLNKYVKFSDPSFNSSQEIPPETVWGGIFDSLLRYNFRPEVDCDVISGEPVDNVGMNAHVKLGDSRSNGSRYIRGADFVWKKTNISKPITKGRNVL